MKKRQGSTILSTLRLETFETINKPFLRNVNDFQFVSILRVTNEIFCRYPMSVVCVCVCFGMFPRHPVESKFSLSAIFDRLVFMKVVRTMRVYPLIPAISTYTHVLTPFRSAE